MPYITEIQKDGDLNVAMQNFSTICSANSAILGLTPANITEIQGASTAFNTAFNSSTAAKAAANSAVESKDMQKRNSKAIISKWAKVFRANQAVPDNLLEQLMLPHHKTPGTKTPPTQPINLTGTPDVQALVRLAWNRNGNRSGTQFLIEVQVAPGGEWSVGGSTTKTKFNYQAVLNEYIAFRIVATRNDLESQPSLPVTLWANGGGQALADAA